MWFEWYLVGCMFGNEIQEVWVVKPRNWMVEMPKIEAGIELQNRNGQTEHEPRFDRSCSVTQEICLTNNSEFEWINWGRGRSDQRMTIKNNNFQLLRPNGVWWVLSPTEGQLGVTKAVTEGHKCGLSDGKLPVLYISLIHSILLG